MSIILFIIIILFFTGLKLFVINASLFNSSFLIVTDLALISLSALTCYT